MAESQDHPLKRRMEVVIRYYSELVMPLSKTVFTNVFHSFLVDLFLKFMFISFFLAFMPRT